MLADNNSGNPRQTAAWSLLEQHARDSQALSLPKLLDDPDRYPNFSLQLGELCLDFSRQRVNSETMRLLLELASQCDLAGHIEAMFSGASVNASEDRAALHTALRAEYSSGVKVDGEDIYPLVEAERERFLGFADAVRAGQRTGYADTRIRQVINIGIGGSDLGPRMVSNVLAVADAPLKVDYAAGLDGIELQRLLKDADPAATLFIVCSKSFTTLETRSNADAARAWLLQSLPEEAVASNFVAVSVNDPALDEFGIAPDARFRIWDWVGGRYSVWSAIGLAAAMTMGSKLFREFLHGAAAMDEHFRRTPFEQNVPVVTALLGIWNRNFLGLSENVVLPYDQRLEYLPAYLQQLVMESQGKGVRQDGVPVDYVTGGSLWGGPGSNAQHSFSQWLQQGNESAYIDYIGTVNGPVVELADAHMQALVNMLAQSETLARGRDAGEVSPGLKADGFDTGQIDMLAPQKAHPGNRPSSILLLRSLSPANLGMLLALYEHQVYVQSVIWGINPFDQWGVELGKVRAKEYSAALAANATDQLPAISGQIMAWKDS